MSFDFLDALIFAFLDAVLVVFFNAFLKLFFHCCVSLGHWGPIRPVCRPQLKAAAAVYTALVSSAPTRPPVPVLTQLQQRQPAALVHCSAQPAVLLGRPASPSSLCLRRRQLQSSADSRVVRSSGGPIHVSAVV